MRLGIDVGGTNTDAVLVSQGAVVATAKRPTTADVSSGIVDATRAVLRETDLAGQRIERVIIGTTHFANAFVEQKDLLKVAVVRLAGKAAAAVPPMSGWPAPLKQQVAGPCFQLAGGYEFDGRENSVFDESAVRKAAQEIRARGIKSVAISCVFSPLRAEMERRAADIFREEMPGVSLTTSASIGRIGFLERENAAIINSSLLGIGRKIMRSIDEALPALGIHAPCYIAQNDGTVATSGYASDFPVLTFGSGPTNSMRGAAFLTGIQDAIVIDVGGTTTDIGALVHGFPRESSIAVEIGGVRTNFRMPDILSLGVGGGSRIRVPADGQGLTVGPDSVGFRLLQEAMVFGGETLTASDVAVKAGLVHLGDPARVPDLTTKVVAQFLERIGKTFEEGLDWMKTSAEDVPVILVGGGSFLVPRTRRALLG